MDPLQLESRIWFGVTSAVIVARFVSRIMLRGSIKKLQVDDFIMFLALITNTIFIVAVNALATINTNLIAPDDPLELGHDDIAERISGAKVVVVTEQMQILTTWFVKACLLIQYNRITSVIGQNFLAKLVGVYVALGFVIMEILFFTAWCRPFNQYWAVPPENPQCATYAHHLITNAVFNISSDVMIIAIPFPLLLHLVSLPVTKRIIMGAMFALGSFTIISSILNKVYSFTDPYSILWIHWYVRESSTALIVANLPCTWTLLQRIFNLPSFLKRNTRTPGERDRETVPYEQVTSAATGDAPPSPIHS